MSAISNAVRNENGATTVATSSGTKQVLNKALSFFKGALIASAVVYVTITWALQAVARFN